MEDIKQEKKEEKTDEVLEDIEEIEEIEDTPKKDEIKSDVANTKNVSENNSDKVDNNKGLEKTEVISDNSLISSEKKSNKKVLIITLLSILLVIDVAALVIYLIGIEKVISFIK